MFIENKVRLVEALFEKLDAEIQGFQTATSLHCISGCGNCCTKPDIDASPLEFFPWAFHLFLNDEAENMLAKLNSKTSKVCEIYQPFSLHETTQGSCGNYPFRGLICRLFGYAASRDKLGILRLATCKIIKENQAEYFKASEVAIANGLYVPIFTNYYMQLSQIDYQLGTLMMPINKALKYAIEEVLHYYAYHPYIGDMKKVA
jgi:uncharacterized protein